MHILLTRPLDDCYNIILKFKSLGHQVSHLPLLNVSKVDYEKINFSEYNGIIFTSANAIKYLDLKSNMRVLEIGTGSGYQTMILSRIARFVYTVERYRTLHYKAKELLKLIKATNIFFKHADGGLGWEEQAPFDRIIVTACANEVPEKLVNQLTDDGIMIVPVGEIHDEQILKKVIKENNKIHIIDLEKVRFVPLIEGIEKK